MKSLMSFAVAALLASPPMLAAEAPAHIAAAVAAAERSDKDRERDQRDRPADVMAFAGVKPGMVIADVFGGGGYWSELLARAAGPAGKVILVNNAPYVNFAREDLKTRFAEGRLANTNIERRTIETCDMKLGSARYDLILIVMSYHDIYYVDEEGGWPAIDADGFLKQLHTALKPDGRLLIIDHAAAAGAGNKVAGEIHRIEESFAKKDIESHGFTFEKSWDGYRNPSDDLSKLVFDPAVRGKTDRFTHLYRRR
jgi:predicted methyltransferase